MPVTAATKVGKRAESASTFTFVGNSCYAGIFLASNFYIECDIEAQLNSQADGR